MGLYDSSYYPDLLRNLQQYSAQRRAATGRGLSPGEMRGATEGFQNAQNARNLEMAKAQMQTRASQVMHNQTINQQNKAMNQQSDMATAQGLMSLPSKALGGYSAYKYLTKPGGLLSSVPGVSGAETRFANPNNGIAANPNTPYTGGNESAYAGMPESVPDTSPVASPVVESTIPADTTASNVTPGLSGISGGIGGAAGGFAGNYLKDEYGVNGAGPVLGAAGSTIGAGIATGNYWNPVGWALAARGLLGETIDQPGGQEGSSARDVSDSVSYGGDVFKAMQNPTEHDNFDTLNKYWQFINTGSPIGAMPYMKLGNSPYDWMSDTMNDWGMNPGDWF